jgi:outer membrane receptor protein involved in Fe transport
MWNHNMTTILGKPFGLNALRCGIAATCILLAVRAIAADATGPSAPTEGTNTALDEIIVTSQRREEKLDKVPISVTAFSQKTMDDLHIQSFSDLATVVPGLIVSTPVGGNQDSSDVAIRGIFSGGNAPTTQFYIDETPVAIRVLGAAGPSGSPHPDIFDLDRVEVLRGPQGTLFGSSAMGGAIRYITPQPNLNDSSGYSKADFSYTDRGAPSYEIGVAYGAPIVTGTAGFRVSAWFQSEGGFIDKEDPFTGDILKRNANSSDSYVIRPAFTWAPMEGLTITPALFMQHIHSEDSSTYWTNYLPNPESGAHVSGALPDPLTDDLDVSSLAIKYDFAGLSFQSDTSYLDRRAVAIDDFTHAAEDIYSGNPFVPGLSPTFHTYFDDNTYTHALQQEFRLSSRDPSSRVAWVAGLYYRRALQRLFQCLPGTLDPLTEAIAGENTLQFTGFPNYTLSNGQVCNAYTDFRTTDISEAAFGEITVEIVSRLKANVGVRVEHSVVEDQRQLSAGPLDGLNYANQLLPDQVGNPVTPRYGLTYQYTDNDMVYVSAAKGYRAGGGNGATSIGNPLCTPSLTALGLTIVPNSFSPDSLWSYEVGAKDSLFDRRVSIQASAFLIDWTNIQTNVNLPSCAEVFTANRGKAVSRGFDLQVAAIVAEGLKVGANVGYTDAHYPNAAFGAPTNGVAPLLNAAGDKLANVLPWTAAANVEYSRDTSPLWANTRSYLRVDYRWLSAANALDPKTASYDPETSPYQNPAYSVLNLRVGVIHGGLDLSAYVNNATKSDPTLSYAHDATGDPMFYGTAIRPLTAGVTAYYRF